MQIILAYIHANTFCLVEVEVEGSGLLRGKASFTALYKFVSVILFFGFSFELVVILFLIPSFNECVN